MAFLSFIVSLVAVGVSIASWRVATKAFRFGHRPMVRVIAGVNYRVDVLGGGSRPMPPQGMELGQVILKNIGPAPALTVVAFDPEQAAVIGEVQLVEPLGAGKDESDRIGRVTLTLQRRMMIGNDYHLYYQDTLGGWHLTRFRPKSLKIECIFAGQVKRVPNEVEPLGTVLKP